MPKKITTKRTKAFTLAELLITLGIVGVVAALTIPTLVRDKAETERVSALKKAYSTLTSAYSQAVQTEGPPDTWGIPSGFDAPQMFTMLRPYLNIDKDCIDGKLGCFPTDTSYKRLGTTSGNEGVVDRMALPKLRLADGTLLWAAGYSPNCKAIYGTSNALRNICGSYIQDINGYKKPNQYGKDVFIFLLTKYGIVPAGTEQFTNVAFNFPTGCNRDSGTGYGCAAWVLHNENTDYLDCSDLNWSTKTTCD